MNMLDLLGMGIRIQRMLSNVILHISFGIRIYRNVPSDLMGLSMRQKLGLIDK